MKRERDDLFGIFSVIFKLSTKSRIIAWNTFEYIYSNFNPTNPTFHPNILVKTPWLVFIQVCFNEDGIEVCPDDLAKAKIPTENCLPSAPPPEDFDTPPSYDTCGPREILSNNQWTSWSSKRSLRMRFTTSTPLCSGVLVTEKFIVTSAYCAKESMKLSEEKPGNFLKVKFL